MDPVTTVAVVTAVISAAGTVLAAWVQGRAQRSASPSGQQTADQGEPVSAAGTNTAAGRELPPDEATTRPHRGRRRRSATLDLGRVFQHAPWTFGTGPRPFRKSIHDICSDAMSEQRLAVGGGN